MKQEVLVKMEEAKVTEREIEEIVKLKADLAKKELDSSRCYYCNFSLTKELAFRFPGCS